MEKFNTLTIEATENFQKLKAEIENCHNNTSSNHKQMTNSINEMKDLLLLLTKNQERF